MAEAPKVLRIEGRAMLTVRASADAAESVAAAMGLDAPGVRRIEASGDRAMAWMSPDEWLLMAPMADGPALTRAVEAALGDRHALVVDVSDARALFRVEGPGAREVLAKGAPVDLSEAGFGHGDFRRTRLGQVACAFWMVRDDAFELVCFRSVAAHVGAWLVNAARPGSLPAVL